MKVVIVAKTRRGAGACIGAINFDGQSIRLVAADAERNEYVGLDYNIGDVWEVQGAATTAITPPHVENWTVQCKSQLPLRVDPVSFIEHYMPPKLGDIGVLYEGLPQATSTGALYIAQPAGIPAYSTTFWRPDQPLVIDLEGKKIRYRYPTADGGRTLTFVGFQEPLSIIPAGTLLRVSLAHWWRPDEKEGQEERCYLQLSGWFLADCRPDVIAPSLVQKSSAVSVSNNTHTEVSSQSTPPALLKRIFGYDNFRPFQAEIIDNILAQRDTLVIMPTGGGKSLCYQIPALLFAGLTVVVSPLISLMQDQVEQLRQAGVAAICLNSTLTYVEYLAGIQQVRIGKSKLLYLAPETLLRPETLLLLEQVGVACLVIDEAHCISQWGHDFRIEYRQLAEIRRRLPQAICIALTATATARVQDDIKTTLGFREENTFVTGFDRPNLFLDVKPKQNGLQQVLTFLAAHADQTGIIYTSTQHHVDELHAALVAVGIKALPYHGGMEGAARTRNQRAFMRDDVRIMVATVAFGMGINKPDVRFVLHVDLPQDMESYYQQIGRAGRDGLRADCLLLFSYGDLHTINHFIEQGAPAEVEGRRARLQIMVNWVESFECRRKGLLAYFGESYADEPCTMCDNCLRQPEQQIDLTLPAQKFLSCVSRTNETFGVGHIIKVLRGSKAQDVLRWQHDKLSTYGIGKEYPEAIWKYLAYQLIRQGLLKQVTGTGSLKLTPKGWAVIKGEKVWGMLSDQPDVATSAETLTYHAELFAQLRTLRKTLADAEQMPPYIIFSDRALQEMATYFPQSVTAFGQIHGVGQVKLEKYGDRFLACIQIFCCEHQIAERTRPRSAVGKPSAVGPRSLEVGNRFRNGESVEVLAQSYHVHRDTILHHLATFVHAGQPLPVDRLLAASTLTSEQQTTILSHFAALGPAKLRPIFEAMGGAVNYTELHLLRAVYCVQTIRPRSRCPP